MEYNQNPNITIGQKNSRTEELGSWVPRFFSFWVLKFMGSYVLMFFSNKNLDFGFIMPHPKLATTIILFKLFTCNFFEEINI